METTVTNANPADYSNSRDRPVEGESTDWENTGRLLIGGSLVAFGLVRRSKMGWGLAALGAGIATLGYTFPKSGQASSSPAIPRKAVTRRAITIGKSQDEVYAFWSKPENLERILPGIESITPLADEKWKWRISLFGPAEISVETEKIMSEPPKLMSWKSVEDSPVEHAGSVTFAQAPGGKGTEVCFTVSWIAKNRMLGLLPSALAKVSGWHASEALRRSKQLLETGELSTARYAPEDTAS